MDLTHDLDDAVLLREDVVDELLRREMLQVFRGAWVLVLRAYPWLTLD